ncbi:hypothetical protein [Oricola sp.]|nr:hypothetical protein [Oricola sp.]
MAKGQKRSNKEIRKPKQEKRVKEEATAGGMPPMTAGKSGAAPKKK